MRLREAFRRIPVDISIAGLPRGVEIALVQDYRFHPAPVLSNYAPRLFGTVGADVVTSSLPPHKQVVRTIMPFGKRKEYKNACLTIVA